MYDKIFKLLFIDNYVAKKHLGYEFWEVKIGEIAYQVAVYQDDWMEEENDEEWTFGLYDEAELILYRSEKISTEKRIKENRIFLSELKRLKNEQPYMFKKNSDQMSLFGIL